MNKEKSLPKDLLECESSIYKSIYQILELTSHSRITVELRFEGIKIVPIIFRIVDSLIKDNYNPIMAFTDFGSAALAKRDFKEHASSIYTLKELITKKDLAEDKLIIAVSPQPYDYEEFEKLVEIANNRFIMINGKLEDTAIGVGYVGRERRTRFIKSWTNAYWIEPLPKCAVLHYYPEDWLTFTYHSDGYRFARSFSNRPDNEVLQEIIN